MLPNDSESCPKTVTLEGIERKKTKQSQQSREGASGLTAKISILARKMRHNARQRDNNKKTNTLALCFIKKVKLFFHSIT